MDTIPAAWLDHGELDFHASADGADQDPDGLRLGCHSPAGMHVKHCNRGEVHAAAAIATRLVVTGNHLSPQPDGIDIAAPGERWHIRGHRLSDGTIMPCLGSYRISSTADLPVASIAPNR